MSELQTFNTAPYFDDYSEDKKFYKILFRPGVAVQARELTQLQTILQQQIKRHGDNIFKDGAMVIPGQVSVDTDYFYVKLQTNYNGTNISGYTDNLVGKVVKGATSGVSAQVVKVVHNDGTNPETLYVKYTNSGTSGTTKVFANNENIVPVDAAIASLVTITATTAATGVGSAVSVERGVYYVGGHFVLCDAQTIILDAYSNTPSYRIGLNVISTDIDSEEDESLLDNALGSYNYSAPGAARHMIDLILDKRTPGSADDAAFVQIASVQGGAVQTMVNKTEYNIIEQTLARRTFDESGDYTVRNFGIDVREHRSNDRGAWKASTVYAIGDVVLANSKYYVNKVAGTSATTAPSHTAGEVAEGSVSWAFTGTPFFNRGIYTPEQGGDESLLAIGLEPGKAYVRGYEIEKIATDYIPVKKARDSVDVANQNISGTIGNYVLVTNVFNSPRIDQFQNVSLYDLPNSTNGQSSGNNIGTARVRSFEYHSGTVGTQTAVYKMSLFGVSAQDFSQVKQLFFSNGSNATNFTADLVLDSYRLTGSVSASGTTAITGNGTLFTTDLKLGQMIRIGTQYRRVNVITSNTSITVDSATTATNEPYFETAARMYEPEASGLIFQMPYYAIKSVRGTDGTIGTSFTTSQRFAVTANASGVLSLSVSGGNDQFGSEAIMSNYICVDQTTGLIVAPTAVSRGAGNTTASVTLGATYASRAFVVYAPISRVGAGTEKTKTLTVGSYTTTVKTTGQQKTIPLNLADGYGLVTVMMDTGTWAAPTGTYSVDITQRYTFNDGQRDSHYDLCSITLNDGEPQPQAPIRVTFQYFAHSVTGDYFTVNSYLATIPYSKIPRFGTRALRDCIDFRPRIDNTGADFTSAGSSVALLPKRGYDIQANFSYYLSRKDKVALGIDGKFFSVTGVSALAPQEPAAPVNGMVLYNLTLEPYTFYANNSSVIVKAIDNKRYTMRDIGRLEKRVDNLEYYTSLSLLEQETKSLTISDATGLDRFKNGFIVDAFTGHGVGDTGSRDYLCSIDMQNNILRPFTSMANVPLYEKNTALTQRVTDGYQVTGDLVTLPYTSVELVKQPYASRTENVNPFAIFTFTGTADLNPSSDDWFETLRRPDVVTNVEGNFNTINQLSEQSGVLGTVWNAWQTQWSGTPVATTDKVVTQNFDATDYGLGAGVWMNRATFSAEDRSLVGGTADLGGVGGGRVLTYETSATELGQSRTGVQTTLVSKVDSIVTEDRIVASAVIPFMRSRNVSFLVRGLKPSTRFYPFFDDVDVTKYVTPATTINITEINGFSADFDYTTNVGGLADETARLLAGNSDNALDRGDVVFVSNRAGTPYTLATSPTTAVVLLNEKNAAGARSIKVIITKGSFSNADTITGSLSGASATINASVTVAAVGGALTANASGDVVGLFKIPNTDAVRFRTGTREFKLTDSATNGQDGTSTSRKQYVANGILQTKEAQVTSTRNAELVQTQVSDNRTIVNSNTRLVADTGWYDPLAQTFLVDSKDGAFITELDLFFQTKDDSIPVKVEIRECVNGYPGKNILPFSHVVKTPDQIAVSADATAATTFKFPSPVYLNDSSEYCIVVMTDSSKYNLWISQLGEQVVGSDRFISEQPYAGVLFKSQNASTWTADQLQDMKFTIRRASFATGVYGDVTFVNEQVQTTALPYNPLQLTLGSPKVRVYHPDHGMSAGSTVTLSGVAATYAGIVAANLNKSLVISDVDMDWYTVSQATNATASGLYGGSTVVATEDVQFDAFQPNIGVSTFADTTLTFSAKTTTAKSADGSETPYVLDTVYSPVAVNDNNVLSRTCLIASAPNQAASALAGSKSFFLKGRMITFNEAVSPVIDMHRLSLTAVKNKVNAPTATNTNVAVVDDRAIAAGGTAIAFNNNGKMGYMSFSVAADMLVNKTLPIGRTITISGSVTANNGDCTVLAVSPDGATVWTDKVFTTAAAGAAITITLKELFVSELAPYGSSTISKYVTRKINLANPSTYLKVRLAASIPPAADVEVWYKVNPLGASLAYENVTYTKMTPDFAIAKNSDGKFYDYEFSLADQVAFDAITVKLVMKSTNTATPPMIKDLRVIACA